MTVAPASRKRVGVTKSCSSALSCSVIPVEKGWFPESGIASIVANGEHALEIGIIGREGMTGVALVMGINERPKHETYVQVAGKGHRLSADYLREPASSAWQLFSSALSFREKIRECS